MKKFGIYCIIIIVALFLGFTTYYFIANKEQIICAYDHNATIKMNINESFALTDVISHKTPHPNTTINVKVSNPEVLNYNTETKVFTASKVGTSVVTITPTNTRFGPYVLNVVVGDGSSQEYPIFISDKDELAQIGTGNWTTNLCYELINDIYLRDTNWTPIPQFAGIFEGANYTIFDMTISSNYPNGGFIGNLATNGIVKNVKFSNANINGSYNYAGVIVGLNNGTICNSQVISSYLENTNTSAYTGMITGGNVFTDNITSGKSARIGMCGTDNSILKAKNYAGGITGYNYSSIIENSYAVLNNINVVNYGGIVGFNKGFKNSYAKIAVIYNCHTGALNVVSTGILSGIASQNESIPTSENTITRSYFTINTENFVGELKTVETSSIEKKTLSEMKITSTYQTWNFTNIWKMGENYAILNHNKPYTQQITENEVVDPNEPEPPTPDQPGINDPINPETPTYETPSSGGSSGGSGSSGTSGTIGNTIPSSKNTYNGNIIDSASIWNMLREMRDHPNSSKVYVIETTMSVDMSNGLEGETWVPIGSASNPFTCKITVKSGASLVFENFNSKGHIYEGFFGYVGSGASISGLTFKNANVEGVNNGSVGIVAGTVATGASIQHVTILDSNIISYRIAGLVAGSNNGNISYISVADSTIKAKSSTNFIGSIAGTNSGNLVNCYSKNNNIIDFSSSSSIGNFGGLAGTNTGSIRNSVVEDNEIKILSNSNNICLGGIAGGNYGTITKSTVLDTTIKASLTNKSAYVGGLSGYNSGSINFIQSKSNFVYGYYAGGLTATNNGDIIACSAGTATLRGKVTGYYSGGLTAINQTNGNINNCLVATVMETPEMSGSRTCGLAFKLEKDSIIKNCFSFAEFTGNGDCLVDSATKYNDPFMKNIWQFMPWETVMGDIQNCATYNISKKSYIFQLFGVGHIDVSQENAQGADNFATFFEKEFNDTYWTFVKGNYPFLK